MSSLDKAADEARRLLLQCYDGVLSTLSVAVAGYPFGSVVPFCLDRGGHPIILIANIAQHRKNLVADARCSLMVFDRSADDLQANGRLTLLADAAPVAAADADTMTRYYRYFPESADYHLTHSFEFWRLTLRRVRFIGGFGAIDWLEPAQMLAPCVFDADQEASMIEHMNADHVDSMRGYLRAHLGADEAASSDPTLAGVDAGGIHVRTARRVYRVEFARAVSSPMEVRQALVALARANH